MMTAQDTFSSCNVTDFHCANTDFFFQGIFLLLFVYLLCFVPPGFILRNFENVFIFKKIFKIWIGVLSSVMEKISFIPGKPENACLLLLQFCHAILIQNQSLVIRFRSQHSFMTSSWFQLRRNSSSLLLLLLPIKRKCSEIYSQCQKF
jgi:hypothetical protein